MTNSENPWPSDRNVPEIEKSLDLTNSYQTVEERYYSKYFFAAENGEDQLVLVHTNRICLVALAPNHPVIKQKKKILKLNFQVSENCNRLNNKVVGKGKKGGQGVDERAILCFVECENDEKFTIRSCVKGKLIGINPKIVENPQWIVEKSAGVSHFGIVYTKIPDGINDLKKRLLTEEDYLKKLEQNGNEDTKEV